MSIKASLSLTVQRAARMSEPRAPISPNVLGITYPGSPWSCQRDDGVDEAIETLVVIKSFLMKLAIKENRLKETLVDNKEHETDFELSIQKARQETVEALRYLVERPTSDIARDNASVKSGSKSTKSSILREITTYS
jgi:hypothetical protein